MRKDCAGKEKFFIYLDDRQVEAYPGEPIAVALYAAGYRHLWTSVKYKRPRGMYDLKLPCYMTVNGVPNVNVCEVKAAPDMKIQVQKGRGEVQYD